MEVEQPNPAPDAAAEEQELVVEVDPADVLQNDQDEDQACVVPERLLNSVNY